MEDLGIWSDATILFTADHGEEFGEHGKYFHRNDPYDELLHVPLIYKNSDTSGDTISSQRSLLDVTPTLLEESGIRQPESLEGSPLLSDPSKDRTVTATTDDMIAIREPDWKYVLAENGDELLFNLNDDPDEQNPVKKKFPEVVERFRNNLNNLRARHQNIDIATPEEGTVYERLESLGYVD